MSDPRIHRLAKQVIEESISIQRGEKLLIDAWDCAEDFASALVEANQHPALYPWQWRKQPIFHTLGLGPVTYTRVWRG